MATSTENDRRIEELIRACEKEFGITMSQQQRKMFRSLMTKTKVSLIRCKIDEIVLYNALKHTKSLTSLDLYESSIGDNGSEMLADALIKNDSLKYLSVNFNQIGPSGAVAIAMMLEQNTSLEGLDMDRNMIGVAGIKALCRALAQNSSLRRLRIGRNQLGDYGADVVAKMLGKNTSLRLLSMVQNNIGVAGRGALSRALMQNNKLHRLRIYLHKDSYFRPPTVPSSTRPTSLNPEEAEKKKRRTIRPIYTPRLLPSAQASAQLSTLGFSTPLIDLTVDDNFSIEPEDPCRALKCQIVRNEEQAARIVEVKREKVEAVAAAESLRNENNELKRKLSAHIERNEEQTARFVKVKREKVEAATAVESLQNQYDTLRQKVEAIEERL